MVKKYRNMHYYQIVFQKMFQDGEIKFKTKKIDKNVP